MFLFFIISFLSKFIYYLFVLNYFVEYVDNYKQDQRRYEDEHQAMKYIRSNEKVVAKRPAPPMDFSE